MRVLIENTKFLLYKVIRIVGIIRVTCIIRGRVLYEEIRCFDTKISYQNWRNFQHCPDDSISLNIELCFIKIPHHVTFIKWFWYRPRSRIRREATPPHGCGIQPLHSTSVFCYQNCSDLLWEKIVLVVEKKIEIRGQEFAKIFRSLEQFVQTVKDQNNFW